MTVKIITESGDTWATTINASEEEARAYFVGKWFNLGSGENDRMERVVSIETIKSNP